MEASQKAREKLDQSIEKNHGSAILKKDLLNMNPSLLNQMCQ